MYGVVWEVRVVMAHCGVLGMPVRWRLEAVCIVRVFCGV